MTSKKIKPWSEVQKRKARAALRHFHAAGGRRSKYERTDSWSDGAPF